jgi:acyl-CoA synthetase (AMP-forming)/AMP-acid ligase II
MARLVARYHVALAKAGLRNGDRVAVQLPNGIDWVAFDIAAMTVGLIAVPLYTYDGVANAAHILADSKARWFVGPRRLAGSVKRQSGAEPARPGWRGTRKCFAAPRRDQLIASDR